MGPLKSIVISVLEGAGGIASTRTLSVQQETISMGETMPLILFTMLNPLPRVAGYPEPPVKLIIFPITEPP